MAYQYPPGQPGYPPQQPPQPQYAQPPAPQAPAPQMGVSVGGVGVNLPMAGGGFAEVSKLGFFGSMAFFAIAGMLVFALLGWILTLAKTVHGSNCYSLAGYLGQASLLLLGLTVVAKLLERKQ